MTDNSKQSERIPWNKREADWAKAAALAKARLVNTNSIAVDRENPRPRVVNRQLIASCAVVMS